MAIVPLKKVTLMALNEEKQTVLSSVQDLGLMHIIPLTSAQKTDGWHRRDILDAVKFLVDCPDRFNVRYHDKKSFDIDAVTARTLEIKSETQQLQERRLELKQIIEREGGWGDFVLPSKEELNGLSLYFYQVPRAKRKKLPYDNAELVWEVVHSDRRYFYVVVIAKQPPKKGVMPVDRLGKTPRRLSDLQQDYEDVRVRLDDLAVERRRMTQWIAFILRDLNMAEDEALRAHVALQTRDEDVFFVLQGWLPEKKLPELKAAAQRSGYALTVEAPAANDTVPTLLDNKGGGGSGEEIVKFYQYPNYSEWDPSAMVFLSFAVFFGIILADAGYSALIGLLMIILWKKLGKTETNKRIRRLGLALSGVGIVMGTLVGSFFGFEPTHPLLQQLYIADINNFDLMMKVSIGIGVVHLSFANLITAWQYRNSLRSLSALGWVAAICAGYGLWIFGSEIKALQYAAIGGLVAVLLFASSRSFTSVKNIVLRFADGFGALTNVSKAFGDALSYMRLFALALAGSSLAVTFNDMAMQANEALPAFGMVAAAVIFTLGHLINFILSIVGGVIHGLRLNLIEFSNWSLFEEGRPFIPFHKKEKTQWNLQ